MAFNGSKTSAFTRESIVSVMDAMLAREAKAGEYAADAPEAIMGEHCTHCRKAVEHLASPSLAVAQAALFQIAEHQLKPADFRCWLKRLMSKIDMSEYEHAW